MRRIDTVSTVVRSAARLALAAVVAVVGLVVMAGPAAAHGNDVSGVTSCASPLGTGYSITWTIANDWDEVENGTVTSATGGLGTLSSTTFTIAAQTTPSKDQGATEPYLTTTLTQKLPAGTTGTVTLDVQGTWSDGTVADDAGSVSLSGLNCAAPIQTLGGHIYLCNNSNPTVTEETGGTLSAAGPSTVAPTANPLAPTDVDAGTYTMTAAPPPGYVLVACGGASVPAAGGTSATESVVVPSGGSAEGIFYVAADAPAIALAKSASISSFSSPGTAVTYSYKVTNTGNVTLTAVTVTDPMVGLSVISCPDASLLPGASETCTAVYLTTLADLNAGSITNTGTATGTPPTGPNVTATSSVTIPATQTPALTVVKTSLDASFAVAGTPLHFSFLVTNTGNVTLTGIVIDDALAGTSDPVCRAVVLAPAATTTCTAVYIATQGDVDAGSVTNTAEATGTPPNGSPVTSPPSTVTVPAIQNPELTVIKTVAEAIYSKPGTVLHYSFLVTNTGNTTMTGITIDDPLPGLSTPVCPVRVLEPGASTTCTATYVTTQADVDAGHVFNTAMVHGVGPVGTGLSSPPSQTVTVPAAQTPALTVVKSVTQKSFSAPDTTLNFSFLVTNTGDVTLTGIVINDELPGLSSLLCPVTTLAPSATTTCTATYLTTQADLDAGHVTNSATATGTPPTGNPVTSPPSTVTVPGGQLPGLTVVKTADQSSFATAGTTLGYSFLVTNTGNVTLSSITVDDELPGVTDPVCPVTTLAPSATTTCTASYVTTQADIDAGHVTNTATVTGLPPSGTLLRSAPSTVTVDSVVPAAAPTAPVTPSTLAFTGIASLDGTVGGGLALVAIGIGFVLAGRRRRLRTGRSRP